MAAGRESFGVWAAVPFLFGRGADADQISVAGLRPTRTRHHPTRGGRAHLRTRHRNEEQREQDSTLAVVVAPTGAVPAASCRQRNA